MTYPSCPPHIVAMIIIAPFILLILIGLLIGFSLKKVREKKKGQLTETIIQDK